MDTLPGLLVFATVVRAGSLTRAAAELDLSRSAVSKQLARFESAVGARLIQRTTRRLSLTELGERVWHEAQTAMKAVDNMKALADDYRKQVRGRLKVSCPVAFGRVHLLPLLSRFHARHPDVELSLQLEDRFVNLVAEGVDVAVRVGHLPDSSLVARKLADLTEPLVVASPDYLARRGAPRVPSDLLDHACLVYSNGDRVFDSWLFDGPDGSQRVQVRGPLAMNDGTGLVDVACQGLGVVLTTAAMAREAVASGRLVPVLPGYRPLGGLPVYAVYPARDWLPTKTSAFIDFLLTELSPRLTAAPSSPAPRPNAGASLRRAGRSPERTSRT